MDIRLFSKYIGLVLFSIFLSLSCSSHDHYHVSREALAACRTALLMRTSPPFVCLFSLYLSLARSLCVSPSCLVCAALNMIIHVSDHIPDRTDLVWLLEHVHTIVRARRDRQRQRDRQTDREREREAVGEVEDGEGERERQRGRE